ncbi:DUF1000-domain-containing protein [Coniophora puteana RWD-64-598 SS2]|uniref:DUF1000-domain-containing protein n=1 Tax=Coniophora puteana (strain RWD-64-598) TaxID=741705 RepID=A0A5M3MYI6_CONPW|nr:DUF1000-domain-containing protein [Coniophora puteana RWD-64-598 SS2]EIW84179.1 DUF1000-domain-containing protein [Coniophora puteana RWD-64-598 SS2]
MPDDHHHHDGCSHEHHDHDHDSPDAGPKDNLYPYIDRPNVVALNASGNGQDVIKPWDERNSDQAFVESDADDQLIIRIPFTGSVKLRSVLLKAGPGDLIPTKMALFANQPDLDFSDIADKTPAQEFEVAQGKEIAEYTVKAAKFTSTSSLTIFLSEAQGGFQSRVYYVGLLGQWSERKKNPIITVYEAQANPADHKKIRGMTDMSSTPQM